MDVDAKLEDLIILVEDAKGMPLSASCLVNRDEVLSLLDDIRSLLPVALQEAETVITTRQAIVAEGHAEAAQIVEEAKVEQARLVSQHEVYLAAVAESEERRRQTDDELTRMRQETDDYIDNKLATFEVALSQALQVVERGRETIRGRQTYHELGAHVDDAESRE